MQDKHWIIAEKGCIILWISFWKIACPSFNSTMEPAMRRAVTYFSSLRFFSLTCLFLLMTALGGSVMASETVDKVKNTVDDGIESVKESASELGEKGEEALGELGDGISDIYQRAKKGVQEVGEGAGELAEEGGKKGEEVLASGKKVSSRPKRAMQLSEEVDKLSQEFLAMACSANDMKCVDQKEREIKAEIIKDCGDSTVLWATDSWFERYECKKNVINWLIRDL